VQAGAGKTGGTIERLLIEHGRIRQNRRALGKRALRDEDFARFRLLKSQNRLCQPKEVIGLFSFAVLFSVFDFFCRTFSIENHLTEAFRGRINSGDWWIKGLLGG